MTSSANEVKREVEGKLSEANENEKYLYSRVMELEKRNQKLEKKVKKLKKKNKELKEEVIKSRRKTVVQHLADDHDATTSDVEIIEEPHFGTVPPSHGEEEQAVNDDVIGNSVDETTSQSKGADQEEESRESSIEGAAEMMEVNSPGVSILTSYEEKPPVKKPPIFSELIENSAKFIKKTQV